MSSLRFIVVTLFASLLAAAAHAGAPPASVAEPAAASPQKATPSPLAAKPVRILNEAADPTSLPKASEPTTPKASEPTTPKAAIAAEPASAPDDEQAASTRAASSSPTAERADVETPAQRRAIPALKSYAPSVVDEREFAQPPQRPQERAVSEPALPPGTEQALRAPSDPASAEDAAMAEAAEVSEEKQRVKEPVAAMPTLEIDVDLAQQQMTVMERGQTIHTWAVSSGRYGYDTPTGAFTPIWMTRMWHSRQYDYAPMPNAIFFSGGAAIHATYATGQLGRPASHGCIRLSPSNAKTLFALVSRHGRTQTRIVVHGRPDFSVSQREMVQAPREYRNSRRSYYAPAYAASRNWSYTPPATGYQPTPQYRAGVKGNRSRVSQNVRPPRGLFSSGF